MSGVASACAGWILASPSMMGRLRFGAFGRDEAPEAYGVAVNAMVVRPSTISGKRTPARSSSTPKTTGLASKQDPPHLKRVLLTSPASHASHGRARSRAEREPSRTAKPPSATKPRAARRRSLKPNRLDGGAYSPLQKHPSSKS